ncbi:MAG: glycosyltransferase family 4 protein [Opitutaceae bacterium]|nr:glycosyltransferase family 4 protein [Opitutaceae bacterium]
MKLLCVIPEYPPDFGGGIATFYGALLPALARRGISVTAIVGSSLSSTTSDAPRESDGVRVVPLDHSRVANLTNRFLAFALAPDFCRHLAAAWAAWEQMDGGAGFDCVECADWGLSFVPWLIRTDGPPTLVRLHASIGQIALHDPQPGFALAEALAQLAETRLLPRAASLTTYGTDNQSWWHRTLGRSIDCRPPPFSSSAKFVLFPPANRGLVAGRIQEWKGPTTLCRALRELGDEAPLIDWFGRSTLTPARHASLAADFPDIWGRRVIPHAPLHPAELRGRQVAARFVVVPSDWDVFNYTAAEALASGTTLICSEGAGAAALVRDGDNGFRFPAGNHVALAARIREVLALSASERSRLGAAALATVLNELDPNRIAALEHEAYANLGPSALNRSSDRSLDAFFTPDPAVSHARSYAATLAQAGLSRIPLPTLLCHTMARLATRCLHR